MPSLVECSVFSLNRVNEQHYFVFALHFNNGSISRSTVLLFVSTLWCSKGGGFVSRNVYLKEMEVLILPGDLCYCLPRHGLLDPWGLAS